MQKVSTVADFMAEARAVLAGGVTRERLDEVGRLLAESSAAPGFVGESGMRSLHGGSASFTILQSDDDGLTLMLARFTPVETPVHDHNSWGVACVVNGTDRYRHWRMGDDGRVEVLYEKELAPGGFVTWLDPPHDKHSQQGVGGDALELVLFGRKVHTMERRYYDPATGEVTTGRPQ